MASAKASEGFAKLCVVKTPLRAPPSAVPHSRYLMGMGMTYGLVTDKGKC